MAKKEIYRVISCGENGELRQRDYPNTEHLEEFHDQIGVDDCSTDLSLRGLPVFRGLIGPMADGKKIVRYESPDVFETLTKEWTKDVAHAKTRRKRSATTRSAN